MKKILGLILASALNAGCIVEPGLDCKLKGGETTSHSAPDLVAQCRANRELVFKCVIVPESMDDPYMSSFNCKSPTLAEDSKALVGHDYVKCNGSTRPDSIVATCVSK